MCEMSMEIFFCLYGKKVYFCTLIKKYVIDGID